ncbi:hypothetical protein NKH77_52035 [Streptomyces sp. M19]
MELTPGHNRLTSHFETGRVGESLPEGKRILGVVNYTTRSDFPVLDHGYPELDINMVTPGAETFAEVWVTDTAAEYGERDGIAYAHDGEYFFCAGRVAPTGGTRRPSKQRM